jgi:hypothetical protein
MKYETPRSGLVLVNPSPPIVLRHGRTRKDYGPPTRKSKVNFGVYSLLNFVGFVLQLFILVNVGVLGLTW